MYIYILIHNHSFLLSIIRMIGLALAIGSTTMLRCLPGIVVSHFIPEPKLRDPKPRLGNPKPGLGDPKRRLGDPKPRLGDLKPRLGDQKPRLGVPKPRLGDANQA